MTWGVAFGATGNRWQELSMRVPVFVPSSVVWTVAFPLMWKILVPWRLPQAWCLVPQPWLAEGDKVRLVAVHLTRMDSNKRLMTPRLLFRSTPADLDYC